MGRGGRGEAGSRSWSTKPGTQLQGIKPGQGGSRSAAWDLAVAWPAPQESRSDIGISASPSSPIVRRRSGDQGLQYLLDN